jgi:tetratricopeptide (TPR) repeat protein
MSKQSKGRKPTPGKNTPKLPPISVKNKPELAPSPTKIVANLGIPDEKLTRLHLLVILFWSALLYINTLGHQFTLDDAIVWYDNEFTLKGFSGLPEIFSNDTFRGFFKVEGKDYLVIGGRYRPLTQAMFAIELSIFGNLPFWGHFFNLLWYSITCLVIYQLLVQLFTLRLERTFAHWLALGVTLLFATHPTHTEAVANIKGRDEIIALLGSITALYFSIKAFQSNKSYWMWLSGLIFFLALMAKENAITFLAVVPLTFYFFTSANFFQIVKHILPAFLATVLFLIIRTAIIPLKFGVVTNELMNNPFLKLVGNTYVPFSSSERLSTIFYTLGRYVQLFFVPHPLSHDYYPRQISIMNWADGKVIMSLVLYLGMGGYTVWGLLKKDLIAYGIWFYLFTLFIVSNLPFAVGTNMSERFLFMPSLGLCVALVIGLGRVFYGKNLDPGNVRPTALLSVIGVVAVLFSIKTITRNPAWKDNLTLFSTDIQTSDKSAKLQNAMGGELITQATTNSKYASQKTQMLLEAEQHLQAAVSIHPGYKDAFLLLGNCYVFLDQYENAIVAYQNAKSLAPGDSSIISNLNIAYRSAGKYYGEKKGDLQKAFGFLQQAYAINPKDYETIRLLGVAYGVSGNSEKAVEFFLKGVAMQPKNAFAWFELGVGYDNGKQPEKAKAAFDEAKKLDAQIAEKFYKTPEKK